MCSHKTVVKILLTDRVIVLLEKITFIRLFWLIDVIELRIIIINKNDENI